jgi:hypothetical protein
LEALTGPVIVLANALLRDNRMWSEALTSA